MAAKLVVQPCRAVQLGGEPFYSSWQQILAWQVVIFLHQTILCQRNPDQFPDVSSKRRSVHGTLSPTESTLHPALSSEKLLR